MWMGEYVIFCCGRFGARSCVFVIILSNICIAAISSYALVWMHIIYIYICVCAGTARWSPPLVWSRSTPPSSCSSPHGMVHVNSWIFMRVHREIVQYEYVTQVLVLHRLLPADAWHALIARCPRCPPPFEGWFRSIHVHNACCSNVHVNQFVCVRISGNGYLDTIL